MNSKLTRYTVIVPHILESVGKVSEEPPTSAPLLSAYKHTLATERGRRMVMNRLVLVSRGPGCYAFKTQPLPFHPTQNADRATAHGGGISNICS